MALESHECLSKNIFGEHTCVVKDYAWTFKNTHMHRPTVTYKWNTEEKCFHNAEWQTCPTLRQLICCRKSSKIAPKTPKFAKFNQNQQNFRHKVFPQTGQSNLAKPSPCGITKASERCFSGLSVEEKFGRNLMKKTF